MLDIYLWGYLLLPLFVWDTYKHCYGAARDEPLLRFSLSVLLGGIATIVWPITLGLIVKDLKS